MDPTDSRADALLEVNTPCSEVDTTTSTSMGHPPPPRHPPKQSVGFDSLRVVAIDEPNKLSKESQAASGFMIYTAIQKRAFVKALYSDVMSTNSVRKQTHKPSGGPAPPRQSVGSDSLRVATIDEPNKLSKGSQAASGSMIYMAIQKRAFVKALYSGAMSTNSVRKQTHKPSGEFDSCLADNTPRNTLNDITGKARCQRPKESSVSVCYK
jgi:hypothetical protein